VTEVASTLELDGGILVGHDGSEHAARAVRWAADWARRVRCDLHVLRTWTLSTAPRPSTWSPGYVPPLTDFEQAVLEELQRDVAALGLTSAESCEVRCHVLHGAPGRRLVEASRGAELVVIASRGRGGFRGLVLGSTADQVVRHAHCPVVVVRAGELNREPAVPDSRLTAS
jgi:nucleotide-binding universal stress UspA family protein